MNILFVVPSYKPAYIYGGPIVVISWLAEQLVQLGHQVTVYTTTANGKTELDVVPGQEVMVDGVRVIYFTRLTKDHTQASPALWKYLDKTVKNYDTVHLHSWWNFLVIGAAWVCRRNGVKPVLSPHGMFSTYILETRNSLKKKWIQKLGGLSLLRNTYLHVSTRLEWEESQRIVPGWQGAVIPNLVILSEKEHPRQRNEEFTIGFLSRIDPKKGLDILIKALAKVSYPYRLQVAGSGDADYIDSLKALAVQCGNSDRIDWVGWKNGEDKFAFLAGLDLFALTSHSENFAVVVIEALLVGTPVLLSDQVGLASYVQEGDFGWVTGVDVDQQAQMLEQIPHEKEKIERINTIVPPQIREEYEEASLAGKYLELYQKIKR